MLIIGMLGGIDYDSQWIRVKAESNDDDRRTDTQVVSRIIHKYFIVKKSH